MTAWIDYRAATNTIEVRLARDAVKPEVALISLPMKNLRDVIMETMYVGFGASSGSYVELHRLYTWNFSIITEAPPSPPVSVVPVPVPPMVANGSNSIDPIPKKQKKNVLVPVLSATVAGFVFVSLSALVICWKYNTTDATQIMPPPITNFKYAQLKAATRNFSSEVLLGKGGFGSVYKGVLANGSVVAVKVLSQNTDEKEFPELSVISHLRHRNLLRLTGWCNEKGKLLLVYDYMPNGSLDRHLFGQFSNLPWQQRYEISVGVAEGLAYLHQGWEQKVIHRDVKASNVLLDNNFVPHLGDFGLAKLIDYDKTTESNTLRAGTLGYMSPELLTYGKVSEKSDMYSFGVLILEICSGQRAVDPSRDMSLVERVGRMMQEGNLLDNADAKLYGCFDHSQMELLLTLGLLCCQHDPQHRPSMRQCCHILKGDESLPPPLSLAVGITPTASQSNASDHCI